MTSTVLITGATGFIGSHLVEWYIGKGWTVHGVARSTPPEPLPTGCQLHQLDLLDRDATLELIEVVRPDVVFHLAARSSVSSSLDDPAGTLAANAAMQYALLDAVLRYDRTVRVVVTGSADEYGDPGESERSLSEEAPLLPLSPYGLSKVTQDLMGHAYWRREGLPVVRARPFSQLGPRRDARFVAGSFARQIALIAHDRQPARVRTGNLDLERDFLDVRDVARALALLAVKGEPGAVYNVASGEPRTLRVLLLTMARSAGVSITIEPDPALRRDGDPQRIVGDASRLRAATGWCPEIAFEQSAADTLDYWMARTGRDGPPGGIR